LLYVVDIILSFTSVNPLVWSFNKLFLGNYFDADCQMIATIQIAKQVCPCSKKTAVLL